jgi:Na+/H+-dicarboxylate symporter
MSASDRSRFPLALQILAALAFAIPAGWLVSRGTLPAGSVPVFAFLGTLFLNALKMVIVPLIMTSIIGGVANISGDANFGRLGVKTLVYYLVTSTLAILVGLAIVNTLQPGVYQGQPLMQALGAAPDAQAEALAASLSERGAGDLAGIFIRMIPANVTAAAASGDLLALIFFSILFGGVLGRLSSPAASQVRLVVEGVLEVMMRITGLVMRLAPLGVFGLVAKVFAEGGAAVLGPMLTFAAGVLGGLAFHLLVVLSLLLWGLARLSPRRHLQAMGPGLLTAFSTASSSATLPVTMECLEHRAQVPRRYTSFVVPLGATVNMDGTALYECMAALFIAQAYGIVLAPSTQFVVVLLALLTSIGVAGIPQASLAAIVIILDAVGVPAEGIGLILGVDRLLDMCRTAVNVYSDSCGAAIIARTEEMRRDVQSGAGPAAAG